MAAATLALSVRCRGATASRGALLALLRGCFSGDHSTLVPSALLLEPASVRGSRGFFCSAFDVHHLLLKAPDPPKAEGEKKEKKRRGNYAEETDRRASISVQVSERALIKGRCVRLCLMEG